MAKFKIELARREDDSDLRRILRENHMPGSLSLTLRREPSFFDSLSVEGDFNQVVVARDTESQRAVGFGVRSIKPTFVNGEIREVGYLGCLRLDKQFRGMTIVPRGYKLLSELHRDKRTPFYLTTIVEDNEYAKRILTSNRVGIPDYHDFGEFFTYAIPIIKRNKSAKVIQATKSNLEDILNFINREGSKKQFYPSYTSKDFSDKGLLRGLKIEDILLHFDGAQIDGVIASWKQNDFKQSVIEKYSQILKYSRPFLNLINRYRGGFPFLPKEGEEIDYSSASIIAVRDNNPMVFNELLNSVSNQLSENKTPILMVGLHSRDSLNKVLRKHTFLRFSTRLYIVNWEDGEKDYQNIDDRIPYLELGAL